MQHLQYPIGNYQTQPFSEAQKNKWLQEIQFLPSDLEAAIENMDAALLAKPYRPGGWSSIQVVHHVADSHMNAYTRFKLGVTENNPTIKPYLEQEWALLHDVNTVPINISITLLYALHTRLHKFLVSLTTAQWQRTIVHPQHGKQLTLWHLLGLYAWHGKHHTAHVLLVKNG